jgi:hypothetical protein
MLTSFSTSISSDYLTRLMACFGEKDRSSSNFLDSHLKDIFSDTLSEQILERINGIS